MKRPSKSYPAGTRRLTAQENRIFQGLVRATLPSATKDGKEFTAAELVKSYKSLFAELRRKGRDTSWTFRRYLLNGTMQIFQVRGHPSYRGSEKLGRPLDTNERLQVAEARRINKQITAYLSEARKQKKEEATRTSG